MTTHNKRKSKKNEKSIPDQQSIIDEPEPKGKIIFSFLAPLVFLAIGLWLLQDAWPQAKLEYQFKHGGPTGSTLATVTDMKFGTKDAKGYKSSNECSYTFKIHGVSYSGHCLIYDTVLEVQDHVKARYLVSNPHANCLEIGQLNSIFTVYVALVGILFAIMMLATSILWPE